MTVSINKSRSSNFKLVFPVLPTTDSLDDSSLFSLNIVGTVLPSISITPIEIPGQGGQVFQEGGGIEYSSWETTFHIDGDGNNYNLLFNGMTSAYDGNNIFGSLTDSYQVNADMLVLDNGDNNIVTGTFQKFWPSSLGNVDLSYQDGNRILSCNVVFTYDIFYRK